MRMLVSVCAGGDGFVMKTPAEGPSSWLTDVSHRPTIASLKDCCSDGWLLFVEANSENKKLAYMQRTF